MRMWNQCILATAKGKTAGTYDEIGTITVTKRANYIVGFYALIVNKKPTADEATSPILKIDSNDVGVSAMKIHGGMIGAEGMAAHQSSYVRKQFYQWSPPVTGESLHFAEITFSVSSVVNNTEGWDCGIQLITSDEQPTPELIEQLRTNACGTWNGGDVAIEAAGAGNSATLASWGTDDDSMIVVDAKAQELLGIAYSINLNAETEGVPLCDYAELTCTDIDDFAPQQHLAQYGAGGSLGTVIDAIREVPVSYLPFVFANLPANKVKISVADINSLTGLTAGDGLLGIVWR